MNVAIVGGGSAAGRHTRIVQDLIPAANIQVFTSTRISRPSSTLAQRRYDVEDLVKFSPSIAVVATPATMREEVLYALSTIDCDILVEKPLAASSEVAHRLAKVLEGERVNLLGYNLRFMRSFAALRELLASGECGRPLFYNCQAGRSLSQWRPGKDYRTSVSAQAHLGGGVLLELSHEFDFLSTLLGPPLSVGAICIDSRLWEIDAEDVALIQLVHAPAESLGTVPGSVTLDMVRQVPKREVEIVCSLASVLWDLNAGTVDIRNEDSQCGITVFRDGEDMRKSYELMWRHFLACVEERHPSRIPLGDGVAPLRVVEAAKESARNGVVVNVGER